MIAGLMSAAGGALLAGALSLAQCGPPTVAGTTEPARAACRLLYGDFATGDANMLWGGCMVPRDPSASNDTKKTCRDALDAAWGVSRDHWLACDQPVG